MIEPADEPPGPTTPAGHGGCEPTDAQTDLLVQLFGSDGDFGATAEASAPPVHWPSLSGDEIGEEMRALYDWVTRLQDRFREMVRLPACWYRHNGIVELLSALRDHERASYAETAAPTAGVAWMIALRDVEARLRSWVADLRCGGETNYHDPSVHAVSRPDTNPPDDLSKWITDAKAIRQRAAVEAAVGDER